MGGTLGGHAFGGPAPAVIPPTPPVAPISPAQPVEPAGCPPPQSDEAMLREFWASLEVAGGAPPQPFCDQSVVIGSPHLSPPGCWRTQPS